MDKTTEWQIMNAIYYCGTGVIFGLWQDSFSAGAFMTLFLICLALTIRHER